MDFDLPLGSSGLGQLFSMTMTILLVRTCIETISVDDIDQGVQVHFGFEKRKLNRIPRAVTEVEVVSMPMPM